MMKMKAEFTPECFQHIPKTDRAAPWSHEPDRVQWVDAVTGYPCLIVRAWAGHLCGYVGITAKHPLYGCPAHHLDRRLAAVHHKYSFSGLPYLSSGIWARLEPSDPAPVWWIGFDCAAPSDLVPTAPIHAPGSVYRSIGYVTEAVTVMAWRVANLDPSFEPRSDVDYPSDGIRHNTRDDAMEYRTIWLNEGTSWWRPKPVKRTYAITGPRRGYDSVHVLLHGATGNEATFPDQLKFDGVPFTERPAVLASRVIVPRGSWCSNVDGLGWNATPALGAALGTTSNDARFLRAVIDKENPDHKPVILWGHSNGSQMAMTLCFEPSGAVNPDIVGIVGWSAIPDVPLSGVVPHVFYLHGAVDTVYPPEGGTAERIAFNQPNVFDAFEERTGTRPADNKGDIVQQFGFDNFTLRAAGHFNAMSAPMLRLAESWNAAMIALHGDE